MQPISPGDIVVSGMETGVVWSIVTRTVLIVLPADKERGARKSSDVSLGEVPFATITGPIRVNIYNRVEWRDVVRIGTLNPEQQAAMRLTMRRCADNQRVEASVRQSAYAQSATSVRSGGRRVGNKVMA